MRVAVTVVGPVRVPATPTWLPTLKLDWLLGAARVPNWVVGVMTTVIAMPSRDSTVQVLPEMAVICPRSTRRWRPRLLVEPVVDPLAGSVVEVAVVGLVAAMLVDEPSSAA